MNMVQNNDLEIQRQFHEDKLAHLDFMVSLYADDADRMRKALIENTAKIFSYRYLVQLHMKALTDIDNKLAAQNCAQVSPVHGELMRKVYAACEPTNKTASNRVSGLIGGAK